MSTKRKIERLIERINKLEEKYYVACEQEHKRMNNMGWGYGMRHSRINFSTRKSDSIKEKIKKCETEIRTLQDEMQSQIVAGIVSHYINKGGKK